LLFGGKTKLKKLPGAWIKLSETAGYVKAVKCEHDSCKIVSMPQKLYKILGPKSDKTKM
jgi:hypothetical protein